ncbi:LOW QUALITY PROTEIN: hypothetical protein KUTeg_018762 [Tegillarca granosa]|uniref:Uncharacterized protein n=1 Tax=Tegillarca granosa TaxID=220873 RepID=A0ABQ9EEC2_TEGGR|nr:LOW QUALITY PROTEIN: hypothetical protein KUTeg_018762 [Tegillarca granosa]
MDETSSEETFILHLKVNNLQKETIFQMFCHHNWDFIQVPKEKWEDEPLPLGENNNKERKERYKYFWKDIKKENPINKDPQRKQFVWHKRDIMPLCVLKLVRNWYPNPEGKPYMGHINWEYPNTGSAHDCQSVYFEFSFFEFKVSDNYKCLLPNNVSNSSEISFDEAYVFQNRVREIELTATE